jgi:hypothetical protein
VGQRTIFSVRPFQRSSPIALYCLLEVAIGGAVVVLVDTVHFPFMVGYTVRTSNHACHTYFSHLSSVKNLKMSRPELQAPPEIVRRLFCPSFLPIRTQEIARHSIMAIRRLENTRTSMRHATEHLISFFLN